MNHKKALERLLDCTTPQSVRKSLIEVFFNYTAVNKGLLPDSFDNIVFDFQLLLQFFEDIDKTVNKEGT